MKILTWGELNALGIRALGLAQQASHDEALAVLAVDSQCASPDMRCALLSFRAQVLQLAERFDDELRVLDERLALCESGSQRHHATMLALATNASLRGDVVTAELWRARAETLRPALYALTIATDRCAFCATTGVETAGTTMAFIRICEPCTTRVIPTVDAGPCPFCGGPGRAEPRICEACSARAQQAFNRASS